MFNYAFFLEKHSKCTKTGLLEAFFGRNVGFFAKKSKKVCIKIKHSLYLPQIQQITICTTLFLINFNHEQN